ncbi:hypothetical protein SCHPADRAFT_195729 [Schizopora paradoxa]|uniref:Uncharacterized protein n=1 Tax=Schizopora paradoxa TaxID=27342 RepID=A0A0H2SID9_9AGAM|nr:hypothetical protein SCHPADRAFT_195729 [Schizopora paradoxa]
MSDMCSRSCLSCLFRNIVDNGKLALPDVNINITFKSPADAFFAFVYTYRVLEVKDVRALILSAKQPNAGKTFKSIWKTVMSRVVEGGLTTKDKFKQIRTPEFLSKTTFVTPGNIDNIIRGVRKARMKPYFDYAAGMPLAVLENVVDFMGAFVCNFARDSSRLRSERSYADDVRRDLVSMSLVHKSWTRLAQVALRRRVALRSINDIHNFMQSPSCGPWTQELVVDIAPPKVRVPKSDDKHELCPTCGEYHERDDGDDDDDDKDSEMEEVSDEEDTFAVPDPRSMWPSICMLVACTPNVRRLAVLMHYRTFDFYASDIDTRGVSLFIKLVGKLKSLEALSLRTLAFHDDSPDLDLANLCKQLSTLPNLRRLAIQGFDNVNSLEDRDVVVQKSYPVSFEGVEPLQLRTLALAIADEPLIQSNESLVWLLRSREVLEELFLYLIIPPREGAWRDRFTSRMLALNFQDISFPSLRRLRLQVYDPPDAPHFKGNFGKLITGFLQQSPALSDLYISFSFMSKLALPKSLITLRLSFHHDRIAFGTSTGIFRKWDARTVRLLNTNDISKLRKLVIVLYCREPIVAEPKGLEMLRMVFGQTLQWCRRNRIDLDFEDEMNSAMYYDERMNNFAFA